MLLDQRFWGGAVCDLVAQGILRLAFQKLGTVLL
jgi:hypothetical protein